MLASSSPSDSAPPDFAQLLAPSGTQMFGPSLSTQPSVPATTVDPSAPLLPCPAELHALFRAAVHSTIRSTARSAARTAVRRALPSRLRRFLSHPPSPRPSPAPCSLPLPTSCPLPPPAPCPLPPPDLSKPIAISPAPQSSTFIPAPLLHTRPEIIILKIIKVKKPVIKCQCGQIKM
jgi:hypothetical protein